MKKTLFILPLLLLAAVSCHKSSPSQTQLSATYIGSVSTGFEGYYKQTTYTFKYNPADFIFVSDPQNQSMLGIKDLKTNVEHGMQVFKNNGDRKSTRLNSSHQIISYAVFCLKKKR